MAGQHTIPGERLGSNSDDYKHRAEERLKRVQEILGRTKALIHESQQLMQCYGQNRCHFIEHTQVVRDLLTAAMDASAADFGNIQLFDSTDHSLRIAAQHGFQNEFLDYFARVRDSDCACGVAMARRSRVTVPDTASDPVF